MSEFANDRRAVRAAIISWWDQRNFRLFYFDEADFRGLFPDTVATSKITEILASLSIAWGDLKDGNPEHFFLNNPVWTKPFIAVGNSKFFFPVRQFNPELWTGNARTSPREMRGPA